MMRYFSRPSDAAFPPPAPSADRDCRARARPRHAAMRSGIENIEAVSGGRDLAGFDPQADGDIGIGGEGG